MVQYFVVSKKSLSSIFRFRLLLKYISLQEEDEMDKSKIRTPGQKCRLQCSQLYNSIFQYRNVDGIQLIDMFMHKPSKRDYPDYYDVSIFIDITFH